MYSFAASSFRANTVARKTQVKAAKGNWLPGSESPAWLDGSMICDYGFDPLGLGKDPEKLAEYREKELLNGRWAMMGVAGGAAAELAGQGNWYEAPSWAFTSGADSTYLGAATPVQDLAIVALAQIGLMGGAEIMRAKETDIEKRMYPGGAFNPMGFGNKSEDELQVLKTKELNNGRLSMCAFLGFMCQVKATGTGPIANITAHLSNPMVNNVGSNGYSLPFLPDLS